MLGAVLALATGAHRRFGPAVVLTAAAASSFPDWDDLPSGVHRVWGHSFLVAPFTGGLIGALGYLVYLSLRGRRRPAATFSRHDLTVWMVLGVLVSLSHVLTDLAYSGRAFTAEWPVALLWPLSNRRWACPLVPWADRGMTLILGSSLAAACVRPAEARVISVFGVVAAAGYVVLWAAARVVRD